jgi:hypothetical protein
MQVHPVLVRESICVNSKRLALVIDTNQEVAAVRIQKSGSGGMP